MNQFFIIVWLLVSIFGIMPLFGQDDPFAGFEVPGEEVQQEKKPSPSPTPSEPTEKKEETTSSSSEADIFAGFTSGETVSQPKKTASIESTPSEDLLEQIESNLNTTLGYLNLYNDYKRIKKALKAKPAPKVVAPEVSKDEKAEKKVSAPSKKIEKPVKAKVPAEFEGFNIPGEEVNLEDYAIEGKKEPAFDAFTIPEEAPKKAEKKAPPTSESAELPEVPTIPEEAPSEAPDVLDISNITELQTSSIPAVPETPEKESLPSVSKMPEKESLPAVPETPEKESLPSVPAIAKTEEQAIEESIPSIPEIAFEPAASAEEEEDDNFFPLSMRALFEYSHAGLNKNSLLNPGNRFKVLENNFRFLLVSNFSYPLYDNENLESPFNIGLEIRDTFVTRTELDVLADRHAENFLQEAYLDMRYGRLNISLGKKNIKPGIGGGYAWNVVDVFAHNSALYELNAGNWNKRGDRPGLYGIEARYSFTFGDLSVVYTPDFTKRAFGNRVARNDTEFRDNTADILLAKFSWRNLFTSAILGDPPKDITPSAPDFIFSYKSRSEDFIEESGRFIPVYERQDTYNFGLVWSVGIGDSLILRTELNYTNNTVGIRNIRETDPIIIPGPGPTPIVLRQFNFERRQEHNFGFIFSLTYTLFDITLDMDYYYNHNGYGRRELDRYFDKIEYIGQHLDPQIIPDLDKYYLGRLGHVASFDTNLIGTHYLYTSLSRSWNIGLKKRELNLRMLTITSLQDFSGNFGTYLTYKFFTYANVQLDFNYFYGKEKSIFGSNPYEWMLLGTLEVIF